MNPGVFFCGLDLLFEPKGMFAYPYAGTTFLFNFEEQWVQRMDTTERHSITVSGYSVTFKGFKL